MNLHAFWLSTHGTVLRCDHHGEAAKEVLEKRFGTNVQLCAAQELLLAKGWLRCRLTPYDLFFERRTPSTEKQAAELKNLAIEHDVRVYDDAGNIVFQPSAYCL